MSLRLRLSASFVLIFASHASLAAETLWQDQPLRDYIAWLASQDIAIIYSSDLVRPEYIVTTEPVSPNSIAALREALQYYGLSLTNGPDDSLLIVRQKNTNGRIDLIVMEDGSAFGIPDVRVFVDDKLLGVTDEDGKLVLTDQQPGPLGLVVEAPGYIDSTPIEIELTARQTLSVRIDLQPLQQSLPEIVVTSSLYNLKYDPAGSHTFLDRDLTTKLPDVGDDAVRSIDRLPGVANGGVSTRSNIRGGVNNEQLFLFDGLRLYEPYHLKDFHALSTIVDQNAIADIDFYSAGYQVPYGDRMSGVIDVSLREPTAETVTELGLSFFSASVLSMGRFGGSDRGDWLLTGRRGNLDLVLDVVNSNYGTPRYEDSVLHVGWELSDRSYVSANALLSYDKISVSELDNSERASAKYRNRIFWFKIDTAWNRNLSSSTILSATQIDNDRVGAVDVPNMTLGNVTDDRHFQSLTLKQDWQWAVSSQWLFSTGFDIKRLEAEYKYDSTLELFPPFDQILDNQPSLIRSIQTAPRGAQYAVYLGSRWRPFDNLILDAGIRWDQQTYTTASDDSQSSPRLNVLYNWGERTELRLGFGMFHQAQEINELQVSDGVTDFFAAQRAQHAVASLSHKLTSGIDLRMEIYKKRYRQLMPRYENVFDPLVLIPELQIDRVRIDAEAAVSRGVEFMVTGGNNAASLLWWLSYTWSEIEDATDEGIVKRSWDQSHTVKAGVNWDWNKWSFSAAGSVHTGWPRTDLILETITNPDGSSELIASTTPRNALRHSVFHSVDARASRRFDVSRGELTVFLEISNLYDRQNPCCTKYRLQTDSSGGQSLDANQGNWLPIIPSLGVNWRF